MEAVDNLFIKITSSSEEAERSLSNLASSLDKLAGSLTKIGSGNDGVKALRGLKNALSGLASVQGLDTIASSIDKMATSLSHVNADSVTAMRSLLSGMGRIANVDTSSFTNISSGISQMGDAIGRLDAEKLRAFADAAQHLGSLPSIGAAASSFQNVTSETDATSTALVNVSNRMMETSNAMETASTRARETADAFALVAARQDLINSGNGGASDTINGQFQDTIIDGQWREAIDSAQRAVESLRNAFQELYRFKPTQLGDTQRYTDEYLRLQRIIENTTNQLYRLSDRLDQMGTLGATDEQWERLQYEIDQTTEKLRGYYSLMEELQSQGRDVASIAPPALDKTGSSLDRVVGHTISLVALSSAIRRVANACDALADAGTRLMGALVTPLRFLARQTGAQIAKVGSLFTGLAKSIKKSISNIIASWSKIFERFKFTLLRKAINAIIKDLNAAMLSLANFSESTGVAFNKAVSSIMADSKYLGASLVAAFAPIVDTIAPMIDYLIEKLVSALNIINQFFAALGGHGVFVVAKKGTADFAKGLDKASGSAKKLKNNLLGIDELNIFQPKNDSSGGGAGGGYEYEWEQLEVSSKIMEFADKVKKVFAQLFEPLKKAWDNAGKYVIDGFNHMKDRALSLFKTIGKDFLAVWNQKATVKMFENILKIIGNIMKAVGNLAGQFEKAWKKNDTGRKILEKIRDIFAIIVEHAKNVSEYIVRWASQINFSPLLESLDRLLGALKGVADFFGQLFEDVMQNIVLKFIKWFIEVGIPKIHDAFASVFSQFNGDKILEDLKPLQDAIENVGESLVTGFAGAVNTVGSEIARWTNSDAFTRFTEGIANILNEITAERVQKVLSGIGLAFTNIMEIIPAFVSSDFVQGFVRMIGGIIDSLTAEDIAGILTNIAAAIAGFRFASFVGRGVSGFLNFINAISTFRGIASAAGGVASGGGLATLSSAGGMLGGVAIAIGGAAAIVTAFGALNAIPGFKEFMRGGGELLAELFKQIGSMIGSLVGGVVEGVFSGLPGVGKSLSDFAENMRPFFTAISEAPMESVSRFVGGLGILMTGLAANNLTSFSFGSTDLSGIGQQLSVFADGAKTFFVKIADFPSAGIDNAPKVFSAIAGMGNYDFKNGGLFQAFTGTSDMARVGTQLAAFASLGKTFFNSVADYSEEGLQKAPKVFEAISGMGNYDFKTGGLFQFFTGHTDITTMGAELMAFAPMAKEFFDCAAKFSDEGMEKSPKVFEAISGMGNYDFKMGGIFQMFTGYTDMGTIGVQLSAFGVLAGKFFDAVAKYPDEGLTKAPKVFQALSGMGQYDFKMGGLFQLFTGYTDMGTVGVQLASFGKFAGKFYVSVSQYPEAGITKAEKVFASLSMLSSYDFKTGGIVQYIMGSNDLSLLGAQLTVFAAGIRPFYTNIDKVSDSAIAKGEKVLESIASLSGIKSGGLLSWISGSGDLARAGAQLAEFGKSSYYFYNAVDKLSTNSFKNGKMAIEVLTGTPAASSGSFLYSLSSSDFRSGISALTEVSTPLQTFFSSISKIPQEAFEKTKQMFAVFTNANANFVQLGAGLSNFIELLNRLGQVFMSVGRTPELLIKAMTYLTEAVTKAIQATTKMNETFPKFRSAVVSAANGPNQMVSSISKLKTSLVNLYNTMVKVINLTNKFKSTMNSVSSIKVSTSGIKGYATGGFPEDGLFFANHSELVGQFSNGQTAVANNAQIISGIESGVERGVAKAMSGMSGGGSQVLTVELDGREIYRSVVSQNNSMIQRTGTSPLYA